MALFDLTRIYGKPYTVDQGSSLGVPIATSPLESTEKPSRSTVAQCYEAIEKDLTDAINSNALPKTNEVGYVNLWAAKALQVRVYLSLIHILKVPYEKSDGSQVDRALGVPQGSVIAVSYTHLSR